MAQQTTVYMKSFIKQLDDLVTKLCHQFPTEQDIKYLSTLISGLKLINPYELVSQYYIKIYKYREFIEKKDEKYFIDNSFEDDIDEDADKKVAQMKIDYFRNLIISGSVSKETKNVVWTYLNLLNKLIDRMIDNGEFKVPQASA